MRLSWLLAVAFCGCCDWNVATARDLRISAFNVQVFGETKAKKADVMKTLAKIIQRYDIVLIQEIRDSKEQAIYKLINQANDLGPAEYDVVVSDRLGRSSSKEQYAFIYRLDAGISVEEVYHYPDPSEEFEREPFAVRFKSTQSVVSDFVLAGIHVDPDTAVQEIESLQRVFTALQTHFKTVNIIIMGDFNADCTYVSQSSLANLNLRGSKYTWLIGDELDTTTKSTDCTYDRIVGLTGSKLVGAVVPRSAAVFRFDVKYGLTEEQTQAVSDHYPVEFSLASRRSASTSASSTLWSVFASKLKKST